MTHERVDVAVIGRGLIGSGAGRHLAESGRSMALIGPGEPSDWNTSDGPFSSHHDQGRITRIAGRNAMWTEVAAPPALDTPTSRARSGIGFHTPRGVLVSYPDAADWVDRRALGERRPPRRPGLGAERDGCGDRERARHALEGAPAGHINPRRLVAAQTRLTELAGGVVIDDAVRAVERRNGGFELSGAFGSIMADRILVSTGGFGSELFDWKLDVERRARTIVMARLADDGRIPSLILDQPPDDRVQEVYWVPPVEYPDGSVRIKIGGNMKDTILLEPDELVDWFHGDGDPAEIDCLGNNRALLPTHRLVMSRRSRASSPAPHRDALHRHGRRRHRRCDRRQRLGCEIE